MGLITRKKLVKKLLPELTKLFADEYEKYSLRQAREALGGASVLHGAIRSINAKNDKGDVGTDK
jgi:hypothetical protein